MPKPRVVLILLILLLILVEKFIPCQHSHVSKYMYYSINNTNEKHLLVTSALLVKKNRWNDKLHVPYILTNLKENSTVALN